MTVVSNATPLIYLAAIGKFDLLQWSVTFNLTDATVYN